MANLPHTNQGYGSTADAGELLAFLSNVFTDNLRMEAAGLPGMPVCIWGRHGIGKTEIVRQFARDNGFGLAVLSPAQIEEMGDLLGMPTISPNGKTTFLPPDWVPTNLGPGILLIDDVNRADDRILRGIMQLLQDRALMSWALPAQWHIVLTANPDDGHYAVTPLDDALLSRMMHITLRFDLKAWVRWAAVQKLDERGIHFVLANPEVITGKRTTARTLTRFFHAIARWPSLEAGDRQVQLLAEAALDVETSTAFIEFLRWGAGKLPPPEQILQSDNFSEQVASPLNGLLQGPPKRIDLLAAICTRMEIYLIEYQGKPSPRELANLKAFLLWDTLGRELRFSLARIVAAQASEVFQSVLADPEVAQAIL